MIPVYDPLTLPCIEITYQNQKEQTKKYLGGRALTGQEYATLNFFMTSDTEAKALYDFWKDDCNSGLTAFLVAIPVFGAVYDETMPTTLVKFVDVLTFDKIDVHWKNSIKVKILGEISYIVDDIGNFIVNDAGNYVVTDQTSNSNKEITYVS